MRAERMKAGTFLLALMFVAAVAAADAPASGGTFTLSSPQISPGGHIGEAQVYKGFGCSGGNVSPALAWRHPPAGTKSFALLMHDPDAPTGSGWWHWVVYNIPADTSALPSGAGDAQKPELPAGALQGRTDFGTQGYGGPCPPPGKPHHYYVRLYALKVARLEVPADATPAMIGFNVHAQSLGEAQLMGLYGR